VWWLVDDRAPRASTAMGSGSRFWRQVTVLHVCLHDSDECVLLSDVVLARRIAIEHQTAVVPVLALGENLQLRNLFDLPALPSSIPTRN